MERARGLDVSPPSRRSQVNTRTEALRLLEQETLEARERFEAEARKRPELWSAYERWRREAGESIRKLLGKDPDLSELWSAYIQFAARLESAVSLPNWPYRIGRDDPTPPSGRKSTA